MNTLQRQITRRGFMGYAIRGLLTLAVGLGPARKLLAMGRKDYPQGIRDMSGKAWINDQPAAIGDTVTSGDTIATGVDSRVVLVVGSASILLRDKTRLTITTGIIEAPQGPFNRVLEIAGGKVLAVFETGGLFDPSKSRIVTRTAVAGIRGSGLYVEDQEDRTYICTCYGTNILQSKTNPAISQKVKTFHHESPRYIYPEHIEKAPVIDHTDAELIHLESLVGRVPPFVRKKGESSGDGDGGY